MGNALGDRHLNALREVVVAASFDAADAAVAWQMLANLRTLLHSDLVMFEGVESECKRSYFSQVCAEDVQSFTSSINPTDKEPFWNLAQVSTTFRLLLGYPDGYRRHLRPLCCRFTGREYNQLEHFDLQLLLPHLETAYRRGQQRRAAQSLTARQVMIMELVRDGYSNAQIAKRLDLAEGTVRTHLNNIYARLAVRSRTEAVNRLFGDGRLMGG